MLADYTSTCVSDAALCALVSMGLSSSVPTRGTRGVSPPRSLAPCEPSLATCSYYSWNCTIKYCNRKILYSQSAAHMHLPPVRTLSEHRLGTVSPGIEVHSYCIYSHARSVSIQSYSPHIPCMQDHLHGTDTATALLRKCRVVIMPSPCKYARSSSY